MAEFRHPETETLVERLLADQLDAEGWQRLLRYAESDPACREYVDLHHGLLESEDDVELPDDAAFGQMRRRVIERVGLRRQASARRLGWREALMHFLRQPLLAGGMAAALLLTLGLGWSLGHDPRLRSIDEDALLAQLDQEADGNHDLAGVEDSPFLLENVRFADAEGDRVALSFDVSRHVRVYRDRNDPLVKEALVQSLLNDRRAGSRLQAMDLARPADDPKVKQGLIFAMLNDSEPAVRQQAQSVLMEFESDPELETAFLTVLTDEASMHMRLRALEFLARQDDSERRVRTLLGQLDAADVSPLLVRAADEELWGEAR